MVLQRQRSFQSLRERMREAAGPEADGTTGPIEVLLKLPDSSTLQGRFPEGAPAAALFAFALGSPWAESCAPGGLRLSTIAPRREVAPGEAISRDFHRATVAVAEAAPSPAQEAAPQQDGGGEEAAATAAAVAVANEAHAVAPLPADETDATTADQERKVASVMNLTGVSRATAQAALEATSWEAEAAANRVLDAASAQPAAAPPRAQHPVAPAAAPSFGTAVLRSDHRPPADNAARVQAVMVRTGATREAATGALQACGWEVDQGVQRILAARVDTQAALRVAHEARQGSAVRAGSAAGASTLGPASCGAEGPVQHFFWGIAMGLLSSLVVGVCTALL